VLERRAQRRELAQRVPAEVALLLELLHVLGGRATRAGLEEAATGEQRDDGEHLGRGADLQDGEEVGQVVAQHVAGDRDDVLALAHARERVLHGLDRGEDLDLEPLGVVLLQVPLHLGDDLPVVGAVPVEPEDGRPAGGAGAVHRQLHPVADGDVLHLAHAEDVALLDLLLEERGAAGVVDDPDGPRAGGHEGLVVGAVLLRLLGHQATLGTLPMVAG